MMREWLPPIPGQERTGQKGPERMYDTEALHLIEEHLDVEAVVARLEELRFGEMSDRKNPPETDEYFSHDLVRAMARLVLELQPRMTEYTTIIGDDASGRIPTLLLRKLINRERERVGLERAVTGFVASGKHHLPEQDKRIREFFQEHAEQLTSGRALVVSEYVESGGSMEELAESISSVQPDFDIATVSARSPGYYDPKVDAHLIYGSQGGAGARLYHQASSGVIKTTERSRPVQPPSAHSRRGRFPAFDQDRTNAARRDIDMLTEAFIPLLDARREYDESSEEVAA